MDIRSVIARRLERGKVDFSLWVERDEAQEAARINLPLAMSYKQEICEASSQLDISTPTEWWPLLMRLPDVVEKPQQEELAEEEWKVATEVMQNAVDALIQFRQQEGMALQQKFQEKLDRIAELLQSIEPFEKSRVTKIRQRIEDGLAAIPAVDYDRGRLEQEMMFYIEKLDINEERVRLRQHCKYFMDTIDGEPYPGKKLGFIIQEMGREINTTGSKANHAGVQNCVVRMKDELEKIREQSMNIL